MYDLVKPYLAPDASHQVTLEQYVDRTLPKLDPHFRVLDLGCGSGHSIDFFRKKAPGAHWVGMDIEDSPEVRARTRTDIDFVTYDGVHIPFEDSHFDVVYSNQVFEHVRHPEALLREIRRVLKPGGFFVGSTSHLEPFHSDSLWNYTPYGFSVIVKDAGLRLVEMGASIDALTLIIRRGLGCPPFFSRWWAKESPLNTLIGLAGKLARLSPGMIASTKLLFSGQFCFLVTKDADAPADDSNRLS